MCGTFSALDFAANAAVEGLPRAIWPPKEEAARPQKTTLSLAKSWKFNIRFQRFHSVYAHFDCVFMLQGLLQIVRGLCSGRKPGFCIGATQVEQICGGG